MLSVPAEGKVSTDICANANSIVLIRILNLQTFFVGSCSYTIELQLTSAKCNAFSLVFV